MSKNSTDRKRRIYDTLGQSYPERDPVAKRAALLYDALLWVSVFVVIAASYSDVYQSYQAFFEAFFDFAVVVLALELAVRLWACTIDPRFSSPIKGRLKYLFTTSLLVNLFIIVPYLAKYIYPTSGAVLNSVIVLVTLKLITRARTFGFVLDVVKAKSHELSVALAIDIILLITFSSFMFIVMHSVDPQGFSSIPAAAWWAAQTLTTVGYGDLTPTTPLGQLLAIIAMFIGIATFAIPIAIVGAGFQEEFAARRGQRRNDDDPVQLLRSLAQLKEEGVITEEQLKTKQNEILERL